MRKTVWVVAALLFLGVVGGGLWHFSDREERNEPSPDPLTTQPREEAEDATLLGRGEPEPAEAAAEPEQPEQAKTGYAIVVSVVDDRTDAPVADALVTLCHQFARIEIEREPHDRTDADGRVTINLPRRRDADCCIVQSAEYAPLVEQLHAHLRGKAEGTEIEIGPLRLLRGSTVSGRVLTEEGRETVPGAELFLAAHSTNGVFGFGFWEMKRLADDDGQFVLEHVRPCPVRTWWLYAVGPTAIGWIQLPASVGHADLDGLEILLQPTARVTVHVEDDAGTPLENALVQAQPHFVPLRTRLYRERNPRWYMGFRASDRVRALFEGQTDAAGTHVFETVPVAAGGGVAYRASASAGGFVPALSDTFELIEGRHHEVTITLERATTVVLKGVVTTADTTEPVAGARILLNGQEKGATDAGGRFTISDVERRNGWTQLQVQAEGYGRVSRRQEIPAAGEVAEIRVELWPVKPITGRVIDQYGAPVVGAYVDLIRTGPAVTSQGSMHTDTEGRFELPNATEHEFNLRVFPPQPYWEWKQEQGGYRVVRGGQTDLVIELHRLPKGKARITALVRDAKTGDPLDPSEAMLLRDRDGSGIPSPQPKIEAGRVLMEAVLPGSYVLWVRVEGRPAAYAAIEVGETDTDVRAEVQVYDEASLGTVRGRVDWGDAPQPAHLFVQTALADSWSQPQWAMRGVGASSGFARVEEDGAFEISKLLPGRTRITASSKGWQGVTTVEVVAGEVAEVVVVLEQLATIHMVVKGKIPDDTETVRFFVSKDGEDWDFKMNLGFRKGARKRASHKATVEPGRWHWKVEFDADNIAGGSRRSAETQTGVVEVARGETAVVEAPVKSRAP